MTHFGVLNIDKPAGWTSRDVVNRVQSLVRPAKAGHAGTLDPLATGVLLVCVGRATRLVQYAQRLPKSYRATFLLGRASATDDVEVEAHSVLDAPRPARDEIESVLPEYMGQIDQRPPAFSAVKVKGRPAYQWARKGHLTELAPRPVTIHALDIEDYSYPELVLRIACGSGTYVRSLGRDLAKSLGTAAVLSALERTAIGSFRVKNAVSAADLDVEKIDRRLLPAQTLLACLPSARLSDRDVIDVWHGRPIRAVEPSPTSCQCNGRIAAVNERDVLVAILQVKDDGRLWPVLNFSNEHVVCGHIAS